MSRIYQGGSSDRRYQSKAQSRGFNPERIVSNAKKIQQEGQAALQNLQTADRERVRGEQMQNLQTSMSDRAAQLDLQAEQQAENAQFQLDQTYERQVLQNAQLTEQQALSYKQSYEKASFSLNQLGRQQRQASSQMFEKQALQNQQMQDSFDLGVKARGQSAQQAVDRAHLQASQAVQRANMQVAQTAISSLINFGMAVYNHSEAQRKEEEGQAQEREAAGIDYLFSDAGSPISETGQVNSVVESESNLRASEVAVESAIQNQAGSAIEAENIRQPMADATMDRNLRQASIGEAAVNFRAEFEGMVADPSTVVMINGQARTLASIDNRPELFEWLKGAATQLTREFGVDGRDAHAMVMQYGRAAKGAISGVYNQLAANVASAKKQDRYQAGLRNAETLLQTENPQLAWETARAAYISSGMAQTSGGLMRSNKDINDAVFDDLLTSSKDPKALANVLKTGQPGTEFGRQREYADKIQREVNRRLTLENGTYRAAQQNTLNQIDQVKQQTRSQLMATEDPEKSFEIRQNAIAQLEQLGPLAYDEINNLAEAGKTNNNVYLSLLEDFETGNPPSTDEITEYAVSGALTVQQKNEFMARAMRSDQINQAISRAGLPSVEKQLEAKVTQVLAAVDVDSAERKGMAAGIVANMLPRVEAQVKQYVISNPEASPFEIQKEAARIMSEAGAEIYDPAKPDAGRLKKDANTGQFNYNYDTSQVVPVHDRINPTTGQAQRKYIQFNVDDIPSDASVNDAFLSKDQFLKAVEVWERGGSDYSDRIKKLAAKLNYSPTSLVRKQAVALGYPAIEKVEAMEAARAQQLGYKIDPEVKEGLDVIGKHESDSVGGYNAINQIGIKGGRGVLGYSGDIRNMPQHGGKALTDMSIAEIMALQADTTQSNESWIAEGRLHAVGRYQFVGKTLRLIVGQTGIDVNEKFTKEVQDYLAGYLLATSKAGLGEWIGPMDNALPAERLEVEQARKALQGAYRILRNPKSTPTQIARASRIVGNPFNR